MSENMNVGANHSGARAVIYIRVSTDRQVSEGASLETQERQCRSMCDQNGWQVVRLFREEGESAKTADRPQLQELLSFCRTSRPRPDYVLIHHVDRWARNAQDHDLLRAYLMKLGVMLRSVSQRLGEDPYDQFYERIVSGLAELDNKLRGMRSVEGMKTRLRGGRWTFKAPLGYRNDKDANGNKTLFPDKDRAPHIVEAFRLFATGLYTREQVRERVNALGLRTLKGKPISSESFDRLLRNPRYAGLLSVESWDLQSAGNYEPLVSVELFQRVQDILTGRRVAVTTRKRNNPDFPLRSFVQCGHCRKPLTASWSKGKMGTKYAYYRCQNRSCPSPVNIRRLELEQGFVEYLRQQRPVPAYLRLFHKVILDVWQSKQADATALVRSLQRQVDEIKERKSKLNAAFVYQQTISREDYQQMLAVLRDDLAEAELKLGQARIDEIDVEELLDFAENLLLDLAGTWLRSSLEQRQRLQQCSSRLESNTQMGFIELRKPASCSKAYVEPATWKS